MDHTDLRRWRTKTMGLSLRKAATAIGCMRNTLTNYESGEQPIPLYVALACEMLAHRHAEVLRLKQKQEDAAEVEARNTKWKSSAAKRAHKRKERTMSRIDYSNMKARDAGRRGVSIADEGNEPRMPGSPAKAVIARRNKADSLAVLANTDPAKLPPVKKIPPKG